MSVNEHVVVADPFGAERDLISHHLGSGLGLSTRGGAPEDDKRSDHYTDLWSGQPTNVNGKNTGSRFA
jgi:hypothetical protein